MLQTIQRRELQSTLPQELHGSGLGFEVEMVVEKRRVEAMADDMLKGITGDLRAALRPIFVARRNLAEERE